MPSKSLLNKRMSGNGHTQGYLILCQSLFGTSSLVGDRVGGNLLEVSDGPCSPQCMLLASPCSPPGCNSIRDPQ